MPPRIPILNRGVDVLSLPLSTKEGFVLSRIDDVSTVEDISMMVGLKLSDLLTMLERMADLGAVKLSWHVSGRPAAPAAVASKQPPPQPAKVVSEDTLRRGVDHPAVQRVLAEPATAMYTEGELDEPGNLSETQKRRVLTAFYGQADKNYYELLGVDRDADKKAIKAAYFELSRLFHPDSLFGKDLGLFKTKMETVFKRLTEAYEVLGRAQRRKEYDEYLASTMTTTAIQSTIDRVDSQVRALSTAPPAAAPARSEPAQAGARDATRTTNVGRGEAASQSHPAAALRSEPEAARRSGTPQAPPSDAPRRESQAHARPPATQEERKAHARERLRRSFAGAGQAVPSSAQASSGSGGARVSDAPPPTAAAVPPMAASAHASVVGRETALKGLRQSLRQSATGAPGGVEPVLAHLRRAREAEQRGDLLGAAAALQAALTLQPNHKDIQAQYERVSKAVTRSLADNYEKQAHYEEKQGKWSAAAASWERVSDGRPDEAQPARAAAECLVRSSGDMLKAQRYAQRAVDAAPNDAANVVALGRVFLALGQRGNARRELEKAVKLDPQNEMIKNLLREAR